MKTKRIVRNIFLIAGGFVLLLIILAEIFKNDMVKMAIERGAKTFDVPLAVGDVDFSLLYRFPLATIEFNDLVMLSDSLSADVDTIAGISKLYASMDMIELIKGNILVKKIDVKDVKAKYIVDSLGNSNFDFLLNSTPTDTIALQNDTTKVQGVYTLDKLSLSNIELEYVDEFLKTSARVYISELEMNGEVEAAGFKAATKGEVIVHSLTYDDFNLEGLANSQLNFNVTALNDTINISEFNLLAGTAALSVDGQFVKKDSAQVNVSFAGVGIDIAENLSMLPQKMLAEYKINKASGKININGTAQGYITPNTLPQVDVDFLLADGGVKYDIYPELKHINLNLNFSNGYSATLESSVLNIKKFHAESANSAFDLSAKIINPEVPQYDITGSASVNLGEISPFVPDSLVKNMSGVLDVRLATSGVMPDSITDDFMDYVLNKSKLSLSLKEVSIKMDSLPVIHGFGGNFAYEPEKIKISDLQLNVPDYKITVVNGYVDAAFKGKMTDYKNLSLKMDSIYLAMPQSSFSASGTISGLEQVKYNISSVVELGLGEIKNMLPDSLANSLSGKIKASIASKGHFNIDSVADKAMPLLFENSHFDVAFDQVNVDMPDSLMCVDNLSGIVKYNNDTLWMNKVVGSYLGLDFSADSTSVSSIYSAAVQNNPKELLVKGNFGAGNLDYAFIEGFMTDTVPKSEEALRVEMEKEPYVQKFTIKAQGKASVRKLIYGNAALNNLESKFLAKPEKGYYVADDFTMDAFNGHLKASVKFQELGGGRAMVSFKTEVYKMDIKKLLEDFDNFDQNEITSEKISGLLSGKLTGESPLHDYEMVTDSFTLSGNLRLEDGGLYNYKPVMDIEKIPGVGMKNMDKLMFSAIDSRLFVYKGKMYVPNTEIRTTSFDAAFYGMQSFKEDYQYHIRIFLGEVFASKSKGAIDKQSKEGGFDKGNKDVTKGRTALYLKSFKKGKKERSWFDNKSDRRDMKIKVMMNENSLKLVFFPKKFTFKIGM